ncbi:Flavin containing amine oxidoreductase-like protein 5 [Elsinoe fawcettii]|nr:Flavin containing amine oxidoreductase-like protein 5 [Elsinoe fawcettii]
MSDATESLPSFRAAYAKQALRENLIEKLDQITEDRHVTELPARTLESRSKYGHDGPSKDIRICIVGAGAAGMGVAIMLSIAGYANINILEASDRHGGRCYSYQFKLGNKCDHNYYDVGAMRIPDIDTMASTFKMINYLNKGKPDPEQVKLVDYVYNAGCEPSMYFYKTKSLDDKAFDFFMTNPTNGILTTNGFLNPETLKPTDNFDAAFNKYMEHEERPDNYSTRGFLMKRGWTFEQIELSETLETSTGLFDQAFMETICDYYDFQVAKSSRWFRVEGGMSKLTDSMFSTASGQASAQFSFDRPVTSMHDNNNKIDITTTDLKTWQSTTTQYDAVFSTTTFGALQRMDLSGLNLTQRQLIGIRALSYDRATKVAIKFSSAWWNKYMPNSKKGPPYKYGGVSSSDLPVSNVVYPSWHDTTNGVDQAHTIIVSYSWAQDATRMASLVQDQNKEKADKNDPLIQLIFMNLTKLWHEDLKPHGVSDEQFHDELFSSYQCHHAFAWSHDPYATGGFALFGPGQFSHMYQQFTKPLCKGKLMICGEAVSAHHAWISGALDSAYNATMTWMQANGDTDGQLKLKASGIGGGKGKHPAEVEEMLIYWNAELADVKQKEDTVRSDSKVAMEVGA